MPPLLTYALLLAAYPLNCSAEPAKKGIFQVKRAQSQTALIF